MKPAGLSTDGPRFNPVWGGAFHPDPKQPYKAVPEPTMNGGALGKLG